MRVCESQFRVYCLLGSLGLLSVLVCQSALAQVSVNVSASSVLHVMPATGIGLHTSVYANNFTQPAVPGAIADSGAQILRYPGGNYASIYHFSTHVAHDGYAASGSHFGNFVTRLLDGSGTQGMVTVNYGASLDNNLGGQPEEAAAWVAYANGDPSLYGTPDDIVLGVDDAGNDWKTAGYWARLRSMTPVENPDNQYDFLAIGRDEPVGIEYWEVGNEINGNGYYTDINSNFGWQNDRHVGYDNPTERANHPLLSPTAYGNNFNEFAAAMKAVDPTIKIGGVLVGPGGVGDVSDPTRNWDRNVLLTAGANMDFGIIHWYPGGSNNVNTNRSQVLNATDDLPGLFDTVRNRIETYVGPGESDRIELHMTEFGYFGTGLGDGYDGVFAANTYATALADGVQSVHWLELSKNSFLGDGSPNPGGAYHGIQLVSHILEPGAEFVSTTSSSGSVEVHSTVLPDGSVGLLLANLNSSARDIDITIEDIALAESGWQWLYGPSVGGAVGTGLRSGLGNEFSVNVPSTSVIALLIDPAAPASGDFNGDGLVDGNDFLHWQRGDSPAPTSDADLALWQRDYSTAAASIEAVTVPEPLTMGLAAASLFWLVSSRWRSC